MLKAGVVDLTSGSWTAGGMFSGLVARALAERAGADGQVAMVTAAEKLDPPAGLRVPVVRLTKPRYSRIDQLKLRLGGSMKPAYFPHTADQAGIDVLLPVIYPTPERELWPRGRAASVGWIPDFQHAYLPEYFDAPTVAARMEECRRCARLNDLVLLSSQAVAGHFRSLLPEFAAKARVAEFPSLFAYEGGLGTPDASLGARYGIPEKFILVINQFWAHKNHRVVVEAAAELRRRGCPAQFVFVGNMADHRQDSRCIASETLQVIARHGLGGSVRMLGRVSRADLVELLRHAAAVLQPSRFEGWSTTVQDAKAIGRPLICSNIAVHVEQAPGAAFFADNDACSLADAVGTIWPQLVAGPDLEREGASLAAEQGFASQYGDKLWALCREAVEIRRSQP